MTELQIALRIVHIGAGVVWVGSVFFFMTFVLPSARALGGQAAPLLVHMSKRRHLTRIIASAATLNVAAGLILYWRNSDGLDLDWISSPVGSGFTVGGVSALIGYVIAVTVVRRSADRIADIGEAIITSGGTPTPEQGAQMGALQQRLRLWGTILLGLLTLTVIAMASASYLY
jgi:hypothetical protein